MTDFATLLRILADQDVAYILVGAFPISRNSV